MYQVSELREIRTSVQSGNLNGIDQVEEAGLVRTDHSMTRLCTWSVASNRSQPGTRWS